MNSHRASRVLIASLACGLMAGSVGCDLWPDNTEQTYLGSRSERAMDNTMWEVSGEEKPQAPMPPAEPAPVAPHQAQPQPAGAGQNK
jgi:hypothetical protein